MPFRETLTRALDLQGQRRLAAAERLLTRLLEDTERQNPGDPRIGVAWNNLGSCFQDDGRYLEAEKAYLRSIDLMEQALGPEHPFLVSTALVNLAGLYLETGQPSKARPLLERGLRAAEVNPAIGSEVSSTLLTDLGTLKASRGQYDRADGLFRQALALERGRATGPRPARAAATLNNLAALAVSRKDSASALRYSRQAVEMLEPRAAEAPVEFSRSLLNLAAVEEKLGSPRAAEVQFRRALAVAESACRPDHPLVGSILASYAELLRIEGRTRQAREMAEQARAILAKSRQQNNLGLAVDVSVILVEQAR